MSVVVAASPFHTGEQALQARAGVRERFEQVGRQVVRDRMPDQHRELFGKLPTLLIGAIDGAGQPWATLLHGAPGFVSTPDARTLAVGTLPGADDPVAPLLPAGAPVGVLGLEPHTRRRNRANGSVAAVHGTGGFDIHVDQSFGNCPKYIQGREPQSVERTAGDALDADATLGAQALDLVRGADTFFIASASTRLPQPAGNGQGVDVSHRGGRPGFVHATTTPTGHWLTVPDYAGNQLFNTFGNLVAWPFAGLLFVDYAGGDLLHVAARAELQHTGPELAPFPGALRLLHLQVLRSRYRPRALPFVWTTPEFAPQFAR